MEKAKDHVKKAADLAADLRNELAKVHQSVSPVLSLFILDIINDASVLAHRLATMRDYME